MDLVIGLGPIGAGVGGALRAAGREVVGLDLDAARAQEWASTHGASAVSSFEDVPWSCVERVIVAVRLAPQVASCFVELRERLVDQARTVCVLTTLTPRDARELLSGVTWARVFEAPLSGGPQAAELGAMTLYVAGPEPTEAEASLFDDIAAQLFWTDDYGKPAVLKLANNTLGAYNALATATMLRLASDQGVDPALFMQVVGASSGQSWMSDNFTRFHHPLLFKDAHLWQEEFGPAPVVTLTPAQPELSETVEAARARLAAADAPAVRS